MLRFSPQWVKRLSAAGIDNNTSEANASRITLCNIFNLFAIGVFILFIFIIALYQWWLIVFVELLFILLFGSSLALNKFKQYSTSRFIFLVSFCGAILFFGWLDYRQTVCVYYYLFVLPLMIFVLFDSRQVIHILTSLCFVLLTYILIKEVKPPFYLRRGNIDEIDEQIMHMLNVVIIFFIISFIAFRFAKIYHQMNDSLIVKQKQLAYNHSLAKAGNWYYSLRYNTFKYSDEMNEIFEITPLDENSKTDYVFDFLSSDDKERFIKNRSVALDNKTSVEDDYEIILRDGTEKFIAAVVQPVMQLNNEVRGLQGVCIDVTEERKAQKFLQEHLSEKEVLLDEIHNRIDYNLQLITGFVQLQMIKTEDAHVREMLDVCRQRIATMSLIHEKMYAANFNSTMFDDYLRELIDNIRKSAQTDQLHVEVITLLESIALDYNNVLPCGLIINELMTNSFKHAFKARAKGIINITMKRVDKNILITYADDGVGYVEPKEHSGIGMDLIQSLTQQLKGTIEFKNQNGFYCELIFRAVKQ